MEASSRTNLKVCLAVVIALVCGWAVAQAGTFSTSDRPSVTTATS